MKAKFLVVTLLVMMGILLPTGLVNAQTPPPYTPKPDGVPTNAKILKIQYLDTCGDAAHPELPCWIIIFQ